MVGQAESRRTCIIGADDSVVAQSAPHHDPGNGGAPAAAASAKALLSSDSGDGDGGEVGSQVKEDLLGEEADDGVRRTGNTLTASACIICAVIGVGVLSLPNATAALGWVGAPICFAATALVTLWTARLLADLYVIDGCRQRTYTDMVGTVFGRAGDIAIGIIQHSNLVLTALAYQITATTITQWLANDYCSSHGIADADCYNSYWFWCIMFGLAQLALSQTPNLEHFWWASAVGAAMSFCYSIIVLVLNCVYIPKNVSGELTDADGAPLGHGDAQGLTDFPSTAAHVWNVLNSVGAILFAFSFSQILLEIQDTIGAAGGGGTPTWRMRRAVDYSLSVMTFFYVTIGVTGYVAFGNKTAGNILQQYVQGPEWVVVMANAMVLVHMIPAFQVWSQPFFEYVDIHVDRAKRFPPALGGGRPWLFRLWFRSLYNVVITFFAILLPFAGVIVGFVGAVGFWPLTVFFPIECWIRVFKPRPPLKKALRAVNFVSFLVTVLAIVGSVALIIQQASTFALFST